MTRTVAVDFFCGAGGMTNGMIRAGIHVLAGVDNASQCERTYFQNKNKNGVRPAYLCKDIFPATEAYPTGQQTEIAADIRNLLADYRRDSGMRKLNLIFAICAPCQPFTKITKIEMSEGRQFKRGNDSNLLLTTLRLIEEFRPAAVICENVEGISKGADSVLAQFQRGLSKIGYAFDAKTINAANFGVPQNRRRTIGLGFDVTKRNVEFEVLDTNPKLSRRVTVGETIGHLPPLAAGESSPSTPNHRARALSDLNLKRISSAKPGQSNQYLLNTPYGDLSLACHQRLTSRQGGKSTFSDTYTRMHADHVAPTITTRCMSLSNGRFGHYDVTQNRAITPREAALLQTFPRGYVFYPETNIELASTLIGNAVPPRIAKFFGSYILERLEQ
jgi:DNA (cytosine-5)-methyltransferase 1